MKKEDGYIVVETVGAFIPFVLLIVSILSLVNIVTLQARVHNALIQTAGAISMYCYVLEVTGIADGLSATEKRASEFRDNIGGVMDGIDAIIGGGGLDGIGGMADSLSSIADDPVGLLKGFANHGLDKLKDVASSALAEPIFHGYLTNGRMSAEAYYDSVRIRYFHPLECEIIDSNDNVKLTANYEVEYTFGALRLPFTPTLRISQSVVTKAWLNGSGEGYKG